ncbi:hypothetical protein DFS34DRAFT_579049 [Phlyctochytrium arcticum]|nr:hypothetical protein DFS34DRAFT_579049 [Phlyctochytrium arcticum]
MAIGIRCKGSLARTLQRRLFSQIACESGISSVKSPTSAVAVGREFELDTLWCLQQYGMQLHRVGGADDKGVDLRGRWKLIKSRTHQQSSEAVEYRVIVQCKKENKRTGPKYLRELEGTLGRESEHTIALLASSSGFSDKAADFVHASKFPLALAVIDAKQELTSLMLNGALKRLIPDLHVYKNVHGEISVWYGESCLRAM